MSPCFPWFCSHAETSTRARWLQFHSAMQLRIGTASVQFSSVAQSCLTLPPHESQHARPLCPSPTPGVHSRLTSIELVMPSSHLILCRPLLLLPSIFPRIRVFSNESVLSSGGQSIGVSASVFVLPMKFRTDFLQN